MARAPTRYSPADPECQSWLLAQLSPVAGPCSLTQAGTCILHTTWLGWKRWLCRRDEGRGLEKEEPPIPSLTHLLLLSLTRSFNGGASQGLTSSMGHLVSRGLCYLGRIWVLRAPPLNPGVPSPFERSLTVTEGTRRHPSSSFSSPWCWVPLYS